MLPWGTCDSKVPKEPFQLLLSFGEVWENRIVLKDKKEVCLYDETTFNP